MQRDPVSEAIIHVREYRAEDPVVLEYWARMLAAEVVRLRAIERRGVDALRGNSSETDEYERGWLDACAEILGKRP